jgi:hypothetical protein
MHIFVFEGGKGKGRGNGRRVGFLFWQSAKKEHEDGDGEDLV